MNKYTIEKKLLIELIVALMSGKNSDIDMRVDVCSKQQFVSNHLKELYKITFEEYQLHNLSYVNEVENEKDVLKDEEFKNLKCKWNKLKKLFSSISDPEEILRQYKMLQ